MNGWIGIGIAGSLLFAALYYWIAAWKNGNRWFWALMGLLFGPFALPFVFFAGHFPKRR